MLRSSFARTITAGTASEQHENHVRFEGDVQHRRTLCRSRTSFDESGRIGLQTPFSEAVSHLWKGGMWIGLRNSLFAVGNGGAGLTHAAVTPEILIDLRCLRFRCFRHFACHLL
jgi:hypothetical protein